MPDPSDEPTSAQRSQSPELSRLVGQPLVLDMASRYVVLGTLVEATPRFVILSDADVHDLRDTSTTRDSYVLDARRFGISVSRSEAWIRIEEIVGISRLDAVVV